MDTLQKLVQTYLQSVGFKLLDIRKDFVVADKLELAGDRDTRLVWIPSTPESERDFSLRELRLIEEFEKLIPQYPNAKYYIVADTLEGFSKNFRSEASNLRVKMRVPIQFFDTPFKHEEAPEAASTIKHLSDEKLLRERVPQPFSILINGTPQEEGADLLSSLSEELIGEKKEYWHPPESPSLRFVVGTAGIGKSVLFKAFFTRLYSHFIDKKRQQRIFYRPIPLIPDYFHQLSNIRTDELITNFIHTDVAAPVSLSTFEWMLVNGYSIWLFDGLDELYAGDANFFDFLLDILTRSESKAQILICARDSLLTTSDSFARFLDDYVSSPEDTIRVYQLNDWKYPSKRTFAWVSFEGVTPRKGRNDPPKVSQFLNTINRSKSLTSLSGLPYYCNLLLEEFKQGTITEFINDFDLLDHVVSGIIKREKDKELLAWEQFEGGEEGLTEWLETIALELYEENFKGLSKFDVEEYAQLVLRSELAPNEYSHIITTLIQFPLFAPGIKPGVITYKHELLGEYLAGRYLLRQIAKDPFRVAQRLGSRLDFADSLIARYLSSQIITQQEAIQAIINTLKTGALKGRDFANLLQLILFAIPALDIIKSNQIILERRDLKGVRFISKNLQGISFRNCDLSNTLFLECNLQDTQFEGTYFSETRFEKLSKESLYGARFGNLQNFQSIYIDKKRIDERQQMIKWVQNITGTTEKIQEPCSAALQLRVLFLKFFRPSGQARSIGLPENALTRGKKYPNAPDPEDCISACLRFGYLQAPDYRKIIKRTPGERCNDIVYFIRDWKLTIEMRQLLNSLCTKNSCDHVPKSYSIKR